MAKLTELLQQLRPTCRRLGLGVKYITDVVSLEQRYAMLPGDSPQGDAVRQGSQGCFRRALPRRWRRA